MNYKSDVILEELKKYLRQVISITQHSSVADFALDLLSRIELLETHQYD